MASARADGVSKIANRAARDHQLPIAWQPQAQLPSSSLVGSFLSAGAILMMVRHWPGCDRLAIPACSEVLVFHKRAWTFPLIFAFCFGCLNFLIDFLYRNLLLLPVSQRKNEARLDRCAPLYSILIGWYQPHRGGWAFGSASGWFRAARPCLIWSFNPGGWPGIP